MEKRVRKGNPKGIEEATKFTQGFNAKGGTNIYGSLQSAFTLPGVEVIYFLIDGLPKEGGNINPKDIIYDVKNGIMVVKL